MADTILRYLAMLQNIPASPRKISARQLHAALKAESFEVDVRSIERDLHKLSTVVGLVSDEGRPAGWSWSQYAPAISMPGMNNATALTYELLQRYLQPVLPRQMLASMEPQFKEARHALDRIATMPISRWVKRIAVLPTGHQLVPPQLDEHVLDVVYDSLLKDLRFEADYQSVDAAAPTRMEVNPLGLVYRQGVHYLVATLWGYADPRHMALHRMSNATSLDKSATPIDGFDFERYVREEKSFDYPSGSDIRLELRVEPWLAKHLEESRLADDQVIASESEDQWSRVVAKVANTDQLFWWLRGLGSSVEVIKPVALRRRMIEQAQQLSEMYADG